MPSFLILETAYSTQAKPEVSLHEIGSVGLDSLLTILFGSRVPLTHLFQEIQGETSCLFSLHAFALLLPKVGKTLVKIA